MERNICGAKLKQTRLERKMKLVEVMAALAVDHQIILDSSAIGRIERSQRSINDKEIIAFCEILELTPNELLGVKK